MTGTTHASCGATKEGSAILIPSKNSAAGAKSRAGTQASAEAGGALCLCVLFADMGWSPTPPPSQSFYWLGPRRMLVFLLCSFFFFFFERRVVLEYKSLKDTLRGGGLVPLRSVRRCGLEPHTSPESVVLLARSLADACVPALLLAPAALFLDGMSMADPSFVAPQLACVVPVMWQSPLALEC